MNYKKWLLKNTASLEGKTVAISGATGGLGRELCRYFCQLSASLILIDRNAKRSESLREQLLAEKPDAQIKSYILDLEDASAARKTAAAHGHGRTVTSSEITSASMIPMISIKALWRSWRNMVMT